MNFNIFENSELQNFLWRKVFKPNVLTLIDALILAIFSKIRIPKFLL